MNEPTEPQGSTGQAGQAPQTPPAVAAPAPDPGKLFLENDEFKKKTIDIARALADHVVDQQVRQVAAEVKSHYVAKAKAHAVKTILGNMQELAGLLPDTDDVELMREAAEHLKRKLATLMPVHASFYPKREEPTALELINYGLAMREWRRHH